MIAIVAGSPLPGQNGIDCMCRVNWGACRRGIWQTGSPAARVFASPDPIGRPPLIVLREKTRQHRREDFDAPEKAFDGDALVVAVKE